MMNCEPCATEQAEASADHRLAALMERVEAACQRAGRDPGEVRVVAVSKTFGPAAVTALAEAGQMVFGESRVQEARQKIPLCPSHLTWHMVGHVQRNKVKDIVPWCALVHSVDSLPLLDRLNAACEEAGRTMAVLLEVNLAREASKYGFSEDEIPRALDHCRGLCQLDVSGLMTLPPFSDKSEDIRPYFKRLRERRDEWRAASGFDLPELSMGMSGDFEIAIEEGATWIRPGTLLFKERLRSRA